MQSSFQEVGEKVINIIFLIYCITRNYTEIDIFFPSRV